MQSWVATAVVIVAFVVGFGAQRGRHRVLAALLHVRGRLAAAARAVGSKTRVLEGKAKDVFAKETATLDIEDTDLRFMVVKRGIVRKWGSLPLQPGTVKGGLVQDPDALALALSEMISSKRLKRGAVIVSLSGFQSVHRTIELPRLSGRLLNQAILIEAKRAMPVSLDQLHLSWQTLSAHDGVARILVLGTPKNLVDAEVKSLQGAKIKPQAMSLKPMVLARMVNRSDALIVDLEPECCGIIVVSGGVPAIMRSIPVQSDSGPVDWAQHILHEFERTLRFYESNYPNAPLNQDTPLFLTGKLAHEKHLADTVASAAGFNVQPLAPALTYANDMPLAQYAVNIGLALKGEKGETGENTFLVRDMDVLPQEYRPHRPSSKQVAMVSGVLMGIVMAFPMYQVANSATAGANQSNNEFAVLQQQFTIRQVKLKELRQLDQAISDGQAREQNLQKILDDFQGISDQRKRAYAALRLPMFSAPDGLLPDGVVLDSVSQDSLTLTVHGTATSYESALQYADALRSADCFSNVQVHSMAKGSGSQDIVTFDVSMDWK